MRKLPINRKAFLTFALLRVFASLSVVVESSEESLDFSAGGTAGAGGGTLFDFCTVARFCVPLRGGGKFRGDPRLFCREDGGGRRAFWRGCKG